MTPDSISLTTLLSELLRQFGPSGLLVFFSGAVVWVLFKQLKMHKQEREAWGLRFDSLQKQSLETIEHNTAALTRLTTIVETTCTQNPSLDPSLNERRYGKFRTR